MSGETDLPDSFDLADGQTPAKNVRWVTKFGGNYVGANNAAVANGKVYIGLKLSGDLTVNKTKNYIRPSSCANDRGSVVWMAKPAHTGIPRECLNALKPGVSKMFFMEYALGVGVT